MRRIIVLMILVLGLGQGLAQSKMSYKLFRSGNDIQPFGSSISLGTVRTLGKQPNESQNFKVNTTTSYDVMFAPINKWGAMTEFGAFMVLPRTFIRRVDLNFGYKMIRGAEGHDALRTSGSDLSFPHDLLSEGSFIQHRGTFRLNGESIHMLGDRGYFHHGPGLGVQVNIKNKDSYLVDEIDIITENPKQGTEVEMMYNVGIGFKLNKSQFLDLYAFTPIYSFAKGKGINATENFFNSEFQLIHFGIRMSYMKYSSDRTCPNFNSEKNSPRLSKKKLNSDSYPW